MTHQRPWHRQACFGDGPRVPFCRERRAVWKARLKMHRRAKRLTPLHEDIGLAMLKRLGSTGRLDPSHATLARDVNCHPRTVQRALAGLKACGLVYWVQRLVRAGWRVEQTSNAYALTIGNIPTGGQKARATSPIEDSIGSSVLPPASSAEIAIAQAALAERRRVIEERLLGKASG